MWEYRIISAGMPATQTILNQWRHDYDIEILYQFAKLDADDAVYKDGVFLITTIRRKPINENI